MTATFGHVFWRIAQHKMTRNRIPEMDELEVLRDAGATGSTVILRLKGPLTIGTLFLLQQKLSDVAEADTVIDVTDVPYIDSAGLGTILSHWAHTQRHGKKFAMTGVSQRIGVLLEISHVNTLLPMFKTAEEADASFIGKA
jgi:anti-sigma B factor antagonist